MFSFVPGREVVRGRLLPMLQAYEVGDTTKLEFESLRYGNDG
jgi:hypothetical protein